MTTRRSKSIRPAKAEAANASIGVSSSDDASTPPRLRDPEIRPARREEIFPIALGAAVLGIIALLVCYSRGYLLLYGDAVAHLGIARRILDSRNPGLVQLGGVWLPLPHVLMLPFVGNMVWWQSGLAGAIPSLACYVLGVAGFYRLCRRLLAPRWALTAVALYALNPNLLYLSATAMTEPLFLALLVWLTVLTAECVTAIRAQRPSSVTWRLVFLGLLIVAAVFTRYDGWVLGAAAWCVVAWHLWRAPILRRQMVPPFAVFTLLALAGPLLWLWYNQHFFHDPLDFLRGPYSAAAIERKTAPPGQHHRGWHNLGWSLLFYTRTAQVDAAAWETGFVLMGAALAGVWASLATAARRCSESPALLLWMPLFFYVYSIAYGSVPIFIPQLWPHSYYNSRYGLELLPALALFGVLGAQNLQRRLAGPRPLPARLLQPVLLSLSVLNAVAMIYQTPLVLKEALVNSTTRVPFERNLAQVLDSFPAGAPILMENSAHIGALQDAGIPLRQTLNEGDWDSWHAALQAPAQRAAYVVALDNDAVADAIARHPQDLEELTILCGTGQGCARIYRSNRFTGRPAQPFVPGAVPSP